MSLATFSPHKTTTMTTTSNYADSSSSISSSPMIGQQLFLLEQETGHQHHDRHRMGQHQHPQQQHHWVYILPVLLLEFLAIALTRAVLPSILLQEYGSRVYLVLGSADCIRGLLAFFACPLFGKLSDLWGRKNCLLITVMGSCSPVCSLALFSWHQTTEGNKVHYTMPTNAIPLFVFLLSLSGIFSSTFTLVFAYISDKVQQRNERVSAFGLALACFGLSFTIGPMAGGYLAQSHTHYVFTCSFLLTLLDLVYIQFVLPESLSQTMPLSISLQHLFQKQPSSSAGTSTSTKAWSPLQSVTFLLRDPFLRKVGEVAFFYYTGVWAVISTLSLYAVRRFHFTPERLGELMSALGLCTMLAEAVLVRIMIPWVGEKKATQIGLLSFALQCLVLGAATEPWHLFVCVGFSLLGNLVYPSLSSLVSSTVDPESNGEALGALNGVKALTEGIGPLIFGAFMTISEDSDLPGWPYWIASLMVLVAYRVSKGLPDDGSANDSYPFDPDNAFVYELQFKQRRHKQSRNNTSTNCFDTEPKAREEEEYQSLLLSEIEEESLSSDGAGITTIRMPFQDSPNRPLELPGDNHDSHMETPPFAIPPSMNQEDPSAPATFGTLPFTATKPTNLFPPSLSELYRKKDDE